MRHRVAYVDWHGSIPSNCPGTAVRRKLADVFRRTFRGYFAVVFSACAVAEGDPHEVARALRGRRAAVVLCFRNCNGARLASWVRAGLGEVVSPPDLAEWLRGRVPSRGRPRLTPARWLTRPPAADTAAFLVASALDDVPVAHVKDWERRVAMSRPQLVALCRRHFRATPDALRLRYLLFAVAATQARRWTRGRQAESLGFSSATTLCRALTRASRRWPRLAIGTCGKSRSAHAGRRGSRLAR